MAMTVHARGLDKPLTAIVQIPQALMQDVGDLIVQMIRTRTERGVDVDGQPFQPLSDDYRKAKTDAGLSGAADLSVSGRMLNDMRATVVGPGVVEIRFTSRGGTAAGRTFIQLSRAVGAADKAYFHHEAGAGRSRVRRRFFDVNASELSRIERKVREHLSRVI